MTLYYPDLTRGKVLRLLLPTVLLVPAVTHAQSMSDPFSQGSGNQNGNGQNPSASQTTATAQRPRVGQIETPESERYQPAQVGNERSVTDARRASENAVQDDADGIRQRAVRLRSTPPSEFENYVSKVVGRPLRRFGANLLIPTSRDFTAPPTTTVPAEYKLNPGDEVSLGLTGSIEGNDLRLTVDPQGRIFVPRIGAVNVVGVRYGDLQSVLASQISRQYRNFRVSVTVAKLRGITVYVTGFAATPGSYTVNSLSTVVNAVLAAGGPSAGGSFRSIQVRRNGRLVADFDLYDLLLRGDKRGDIVLQNADVIYIAPVGAQVAVIGSVNNEAIFEAGPGEKVADILLDAGGVNTVADQSRALVLDPLRVEGFGWEQLTPQEAAVRSVTRGLIVRVLSGVGLERPLQIQPVLVTLSGEVSRPGRYYMKPGTRLADVIANAGGLTPQAFQFATVVTRVSTQLLQTESYDRALQELEFSLTLKPLVTTSPTNEVTTGANLSAARIVIDQLRARKPDGRLVLDLPSVASTLPGDLLIENNDTVYIPPRPTSVGVFGAVNNAASFYYGGTGTIGDFVMRAGGVQRYGQKSRTFVVRANGTVVSGSGLFGKLALPGDLVFVPVNTTRGEIWQRIRDLSGLLVQASVPIAVIATLAK